MTIALENQTLHIPPRTGPAWWVGCETYVFKLTGADTNGAFTIFEMTIPPDSGMPAHIHQREDETCYILEGELEVLEGEDCFAARAGAFIYVPRGTLHTFRNTTQEICRLLVTAAPAGLEEFFREVGQPARAGQKPSPLGSEQRERLIAAAPKYGLSFLDFNQAEF